MKVKSLTVGPILGAVTESNARIFGRGNDWSSSNSFLKWWNNIFNTKQYFYGVARISLSGTSNFTTPNIFRLNPIFDMSGVNIFNDLSPDQEYEYQMGWISSNWENPARIKETPLDWSGIKIYKFKSASAQKNQPRSFIFGSCRYLLRLRSGSYFDSRGDKTFRSVLKQIDAQRETDALIMLGDQIYADDLNFVSPDKRIDQFFQRYQEVFSQPYIRELMARIPTYMTLDDHEIEDNWSARATQKDWVTLFPVAIHAYLTYQLSHSPLFELSADRSKIVGTPSKLWYSFTDGCCDFFIMDARTERYFSDIEEDKRIISVEQMESLKEWLADDSGKIKFIGSSVPFFPDFKETDADKWSGFLYQRTEILDFIFTNKIKQVVFLSGDVHCSMSAELICDEEPDFKVVSIISSAFFWPYAHNQAKSFQLEGELKTLSAHKYHLTNAEPVNSIDNFTRISVDPKALKAEVFSRKGELVSTKKHIFS
ncbi:MAG: alkaline phosphatase D family protein [Cyanobacteria bacterium P01_A01_bin.45]